MTSIYDVAYLTGAAIGGTALTYKLIRLFRFGGHPRSWALTIAMTYATGTAVLSAPTMVTWLDGTTGINNLSSLLECGMEAGFATGMLALVTYWRLPVRRACKLVWTYSKAFFCVVGLLIVLFAFASVPEMRVLDFNTYYARQPIVSAFILTYLVPTITATVASVWQCGKAAKDKYTADVPWLRRVLRYLQAAVAFAILHQVGQAIGLFAAWFGWDRLMWVPTTFSAIAAIGFIPGAMAAVLPGFERVRPAVGRWAGRWQVFVALRPLHRQLRFVNPEAVFVAKGKRFDPHHRVRRQLLELSEWRWALAPRFDPAVRAAAERIGQARGLRAEALQATVEAAQLKAAVRSSRAASPVAVAVAEAPHDGSGVDGEYNWWAGVARAFERSAVVTAALVEAKPGRRGVFVTSASRQGSVSSPGRRGTSST